MRFFARPIIGFCSALSGMCIAADINYGLISLDSNASKTITRNEMVLDLNIQEQGNNRQKVTNTVSARVNQVLQSAKRYSDFNSYLQSRSAYPISEYTNGKRVDKGWQDNATIQIKSKNLDSLNKFAAEVQQQAAIGNINYVVSDDLLRSQETFLTQQAIKQFQQRASEITNSLGGSGYKIVTMDIGNNNRNSGVVRPVAYMKAMQASSDSVAQESAPGETEITLNISGQIQVMGIK